MNTPTQALATHLQMDIQELKDYRYHYGHTTKPVYAINENYYCCTKNKEKPATYRRQSMIFEWVEVKDEFINSFGYKIWMV